MQERNQREIFKKSILDIEYLIQNQRLLFVSFGRIKDEELHTLFKHSYEDLGTEDPALFREWLHIYLQGKKPDFTPALRIHGTPFQIAVRKACMQIPFGTTVSYSKLAEMAGYPRAARAVGSAMASNPLPIIVPCHRVLRSDGNIGAFGGGVNLKIALIRLEKGQT